MTNERNRAVKSRTKRETIRVTFAFSIAFAPPQIAAKVIITVIIWKKMTCSGDCRNVFQTSIVSTSWERPPLMAIWK